MDIVFNLGHSPTRERTRPAQRSPQLADPRPPQPPAPPVRLAQPRVHRLVAWRHDGGMYETQCPTLEAARDRVAMLHWAIYWKFAIQCGRDTVARGLISEPPGQRPARDPSEELEAIARHYRTGELS